MNKILQFLLVAFGTKNDIIIVALYDYSELYSNEFSLSLKFEPLKLTNIYTLTIYIEHTLPKLKQKFLSVSNDVEKFLKNDLGDLGN